MDGLQPKENFQKPEWKAAMEPRAEKGARSRSGFSCASESEKADLSHLGMASGTKILGGCEKPLWYFVGRAWT